ncbi:MAG: sigma-70 family RNA polymerase sigma factor [Elusimicrobium sp.]|jgi:RNA polymerase sigma-70 factor (ECF subfamily)|nr:sigma-70 family RNA polymerase sigma factor [Elusimicrobium sp.]
MSELTDAELLKNFKAGDTACLGFIMERYKAPLFSYIVSMVKDSALAEDIFQEVFLKIVKTPDCYKDTGSFKSWLFTVGRNKCMDHFRAAAAEKSISLDAQEEDEISLHDTIKSDEKEPLDTLINEDDGEAILNALKKLPAEQREVITLRQTMSFKEIAEYLKCPLGTVLARASRGYKKMQVELAKEVAYAGK